MENRSETGRVEGVRVAYLGCLFREGSAHLWCSSRGHVLVLDSREQNENGKETERVEQTDLWEERWRAKALRL